MKKANHFKVASPRPYGQKSVPSQHRGGGYRAVISEIHGFIGILRFCAQKKRKRRLGRAERGMSQRRPKPSNTNKSGKPGWQFEGWPK
ncbi:hypothetical protein [Bradyrhizobium arachidis]|uniref:hypothetical protein n=1 Tax=Bradyrhizobium arachidis TaxID=858423 RepID=UPI002163DFE8|nr:hypothetical protein [Bradyrhizobium arachidis]UVO32901.1 hypothetical protein KUF59_20925 [Bradyrhizobium arachidis]